MISRQVVNQGARDLLHEILPLLDSETVSMFVVHLSDRRSRADQEVFRVLMRLVYERSTGEDAAAHPDRFTGWLEDRVEEITDNEHRVFAGRSRVVPPGWDISKDARP